MKVKVTAATRKRLHDYCISVPLTEESLGARCNLSGMTIRRLLKDQPTARMDTAGALAKELGLPVSDLFGVLK